MKRTSAVNLHNVVTVNQENVGRGSAHLSPRRMGQICAALGFALGCDGES